MQVRLIGYCVEGSLFLVYEYIDNGNLSQHLRGRGKKNTSANRTENFSFGCIDSNECNYRLIFSCTGTIALVYQSANSP